MTDMKLTEHFSLFEMTHTDVEKFKDLNRRKGALYAIPLIALCRTLLEPIRAHFNAPVVIHSGYRCDALNKAIGGSAKSQHIYGQAADFHIQGVDCEKVFDWIKQESGLSYGQLIDERRGGKRWVHISTGDKMQALLFLDGKYMEA